jgi:hypothetical protein
MGKVVSLPAKRANEVAVPCSHKEITVYRQEKMVRCVACGKELDPFTVLLQILQRVPAEEGL